MGQLGLWGSHHSDPISQSWSKYSYQGMTWLGPSHWHGENIAYYETTVSCCQWSGRKWVNCQMMSQDANYPKKGWCKIYSVAFYIDMYVSKRNYRRSPVSGYGSQKMKFYYSVSLRVWSSRIPSRLYKIGSEKFMGGANIQPKLIGG